jgi:signal transduction histidine kinase
MSKLPSAVTRTLGRLPRPLDPVRSFKVKIGLLVSAPVVAAGFTFWIEAHGWLAHWQLRWSLLGALVVSLCITQFLAHGMTSPLREMTAAARAMARGDYTSQVRATSRDEVGELATAFNQMSTDLAAADQYRRELIANVSHELRTPITALQAVLENVVDGVAAADAATLRSALSQTQRLGRLVSELLDLSRLDGGMVPLQRSDIDVRAFLTEAVSQASVGQRMNTFTLDVEPPDMAANADPARLHQVVANLLDNASRHSPSGGRIVVSARPFNAAGGLVIEVCDNGPGISADQRSDVFERFTRGGSRDGGTGLGLAIARWAVELHGGTIAVVGEEPGCRIRVTLPPA